MKTSSNPEGIWCQSYGGMAKRRDGVFERRCIVAADVQRVAEGDGLLYAAMSAELLGELRADRGRCTDHVVSPTCDDDLGDGAVREQFAVGNVGEPMAAFGFIHVMRGDEKGQSLGGELMNLFPKIAARFGIDPGRRFVEQEQFWAVNEAGRERETLFPSAGELARELRLAARQPELLDALSHRLAPVLHAIHARHEIEILRDAQILPEAESLRHVADLALDRFALRDHVVAQDLSAAVIGAQQSAEHADERGLAAAVRAEEAVDFAVRTVRSM